MIQLFPTGIFNKENTAEALGTKLIYKTDFNAIIYDPAMNVKVADPIQMFDADINTTYEADMDGHKAEMTLNQSRDIAQITYNIDEASTIDFYDADGTKIGATLIAPTGIQTLAVDYKNVKKVVLNGVGVMWAYNFEIYFVEPTVPVGESDAPLPKINVWNQFKEVSKSQTHTLAIANNGDLYVWGENTFGQLGDGTTTISLIPKLLTTLPNVTKVSAGNGYSLAITSDGKIWSWGNNDSSQLGRIATTGTPSALVPEEIPSVFGATVIEANAFAIPSLAHSAFIKNGDIYTVGNGEKGKLGTGSIDNQSAITMTTLKSKTKIYTTSGNIIDVSLGSDFMLFYNTDAVLYGVGGNETYQIAQPDAFSHRIKGVDYYNPVLQSLEPVNLKTGNGGVNSIMQVSAGAKHGNAKQTNIQLIWGLSSDGQAYDNLTTKKIAVAIKTGMLQIQSGMYNSYILQADKTVASWGKNDKGQLGNGTSVANSPTAVSVIKSDNSILQNIKKIDDSIALTADDKIWSWGTYPGNGTNVGFYANQINPVTKELEMIVEQGDIINNARQIKITLKNSYSTTMVKISPDSHLKSFFRSAENGRVIKMPVTMENGDLVFNTTINTSGIHTIYSIDSSDVERRQEINVNLAPISDPTILSPVNSSYVIGDTIDLNWGGSNSSTGGIIEYELSLSKDNGVTWEIIKIFSSQTTGSYITTSSDITNEAKFRVRAKNDNGDISNYLVGNIFEIINVPLFETFGNIDLGVANPSNSKVINAVSTEGDMLKFTQYTTTPQAYNINMTFSPFSSGTGNTISSSNLKIKKMILQTDTVEETSGEFSFQDNVPKQIMNIDSLNANKIISYKISPLDIELTIPNDFVPSSNGSEEFTSTITYSVVIIP